MAIFTSSPMKNDSPTSTRSKSIDCYRNQSIAIEINRVR